MDFVTRTLHIEAQPLLAHLPLPVQDCGLLGR